jgi:hypothetical protein
MLAMAEIQVQYMSIDKTEDSKYGISSKATFVLITIWNIWYCGGG